MRESIFKNMKRRDYEYCAVIIVFVVMMVICLTRGKYEYGSTVDWNSQHFSIPEYFRIRFYNTKQLFPSFEFNLGAGQNIYNLSYYGLYNPIIWFSYLLPFVEMKNYIAWSSVILLIISDLLFYIWMRTKYSSKMCFIISLLFTMSASLTLHSHRHIMFVDYMPFLIIAFIGVEKYFEEKKRSLLIFMTFLIIMISYFFSVGAICALGVYGIYIYLKKIKKFEIKDFTKKMFGFGLNFLVSVFMSGILILPTMYCLLTSREKTTTSKILGLKDLIIPRFSGEFVLYNISSMGLTAIFIAAIIYLVCTKKKEDIFLGSVFLAFVVLPICVFALNGTMYVDGKVLIPFLPIGVFAIARFFDDLFNNKEIDLSKLIKIEIIINVFFVVFQDKNKLLNSIYFIDIVFVILSLILYNKYRNKILIVLPALLCAFAVCIVVNFYDKLMPKKEANDNKDELVKKATEYIDRVDSNNIYRTYIDVDNDVNLNKVFNKNTFMMTMYSSLCDQSYNNFYFKKFGAENRYRNSAIMSWGKNVLLNTYFGNKYIISAQVDLLGYEEIKRYSDDVAIYENKNVFPIGYVSSNIMGKKDFEKLRYPYSVEALLKYVIVDKNVENTFKTDIKEYDKKYTLDKTDNLLSMKKLSNNNTRVKVLADNKKTYENVNEISSSVLLKLDNDIRDNIFILKFDVDNTVTKNVYKGSKGDTFVNVNGIRNKLTNPNWKYYNSNTAFEYVLSNKKISKEIKMDFSYGTYNISKFDMFTYDYNKLANLRKNIDEFHISKAKGDNIYGSIDVKKDGYFKMSIPYSKGFSILVDGKKVKFEKVDETFVGFPIKKGKHMIKINYTAPLLIEGKIMSLVGVICFVSCLVIEKRKVFIRVYQKAELRITSYQ